LLHSYKKICQICISIVLPCQADRFRKKKQENDMRSDRSST
jgi:hypothetical protein